MRLFLAVVFGMWCLMSQAQNIDLVANVDVGQESSDIWGYVDSTGVEYAIIGTQSTTQIYSLETPSDPVLRATIQGTSSIWRDIKTFDEHIYVVADQGADGLLVIDMSMAPDTITHSFYKPQLTLTNQIYVLDRCHNLYIDDSGFAYLAGCNFNPGGVLMFDLNVDRDEPQYVGLVNENYAHDVYVQDNRMVTSDISVGSFAIWDVTDKANPVFQASEITSSFFTHNAWFSEDGNYLFTTDERGNAFVDAYDISDLDNIERVDQFQPLATVNEGVIPHNTHFLDNTLVTSWYTDGVVITDVSYPDNMIQIGQYDTWSGNSGGFNGCWGAYPYLPSGLLLASDISTGLYVLQPNVQQACYLHGSVIDDLTSEVINGAVIRILATEMNEGMTNAMGEFKSGISTAGTFMVEASHPLYETDTLELVFTNGQITEVEFELRQKQTYIIDGLITDFNGNPIENAQVSLTGGAIDYEVSTNENGLFKMPVLQGTYTFLAGAWGYGYTTYETLSVDDALYYERQLEEGYQDAFELDYGWATTGNASTGHWERAVPIGTFFQGFLSNPGTDSDSDDGDFCYVTGNSAGGAGNNDIDGGVVRLVSPALDLTRYINPSLNFSTWFFNAGGNAVIDDYLDIYLSDGIDSMLLERNTFDFFTNEWSDIKTYMVEDYMTPTANMHLIAIAVDEGSGHLSEAGLDNFFVGGEITSDTDDLKVEDLGLIIYPNPVIDVLQVNYSNNEDFGIIAYEIFNYTGQLLQSEKIERNNLQFEIPVNELNDGSYLIQFISEEGVSYSKKFVVASSTD